MSTNPLVIAPPSCQLWTPKFVAKNFHTSLINRRRVSWTPKFVAKSFHTSLINRRRVSVRAFFFNPSDEPILKEVVKEPVAFMGGMFAGLLKLDLNEEPLKEWINKTVEASGITEEEIDVQGRNTEEEAPQQINIE